MFLCSTPQGFKKVLLVLVGRKLIQVPLSMPWAMSSPANIDRITESANIYSLLAENSNNSAPR